MCPDVSLRPQHTGKPLCESHSFLWLYDSSTDRILPNSERTLVSLDGTLYFSYVTKADETSYACSLSLSSTQSGHYGPFFRLQVSVPQETPFPPRIDSAQPQVFPEAPTVGSTVYLECFAYGNPVPIYKWSRVDGRRINTKAVSMHHGRVLRIDHAEVSDNGRYKCSAGNSLGVAAGEVTLLLRTPPTIMLHLADRLVPSESVFTLECPLSTMDMHSSVEWFKDAKPIVPLLMPSHQRKRFNVNQNILTVNSTTTADSGVYQCVVSSEVGVASSSAYVLVRDSPPVFPRQAMPKKLFAVNGSSVSIPCFYYASPRGHSRWADAGGAKLPHKGRVRDHHGVLHIENVLHDDAGYFFCSAHNRLGKAHAQMELVVVDKAQVQVDADGSLSPEETVNISCSVAVDCGKSSDCPEAFFKWTFDNRSLDSLSALHVKTKFREQMRHSLQGRRLVQKVNLQVSPGKATRPNKVACFSLYGEDSLDLSPKPQIPPPLALKVEQEQQAVRLAWRKPSTHRDIRNHAVSGEADPSGGYLVELRTKEDRQWRPAPREVIAETESQSVVLDSLIPNTLYQFRIRTVDSSSMGDPSTPTSWIRTPAAPPVEAVESLRWRALDNSTIFVEWDPVETVHHAGDHLRYRLSWSMEDSADAEAVTSGKRTFHSHHLETKNPQAIVRMNATKDCRMLVFSVRPVNDQGAGLTSTDTVAFMNSKDILRGNLLIVGEPRQLNCSTGDADPIVVTVSADFTEWLLGGFIPDSKYTCTLRPFGVDGDEGEPSDPLEIVMKQKPPSEAPVISKLSLRTVESDVGYTTVIEWSAIDFPHANITDAATGYKTCMIYK
ncbi:immunoglobulin domain protein [Ancylostoma duodenale]|uniref:Immunoglobulin domain protein n=1 Tax=Ancylostoma duodenale TaxID=51022 RepID=A0A0C2GP46_9BILA|nr:immunoglobulin domain protein [Ancylostoma duodenale]